MRRLVLLMFITLLTVGMIGCSEDSGDPSGPGGGGSGDLNVPTDLTATVLSDTEVELNWTDTNNGTTQYVIDRRIGGANWAVLATLDAGKTSHIDDDLDEGTTYTYRVYAKLDETTSNVTSETTVVTLPKVPSNFSVARITSTQISLEWNDRSEVETGYEIQRKAGNETEFQALETLAANKSSYDDTELIPSTSYQYRLRAVLNESVSEWSDEIATMTPGAPTDLMAEATSYNEIELSWTDNTPNEAGFKIDQQQVGAANWTEIASVDPDITAYTCTDLLEGTRYRFRVKAFLANGESDYSDEVQETTHPMAPTNLVAMQDEDVTMKINLTWDDVSAGESGFELQRKTVGDWSDLATLLPNSDNYEDTDVSTNVTYTYRIRSMMGEVSSLWSDEAIATVEILVPADPSDLTVEATSPFSVRVTWTDNSDNETGFRIERSLEQDARYSVQATLNADATSFDDEGLDDQVNYYYRVYAFNDNGWSDYSNVGSITTPKGPPTAPRTLTAPTIESDAVRLVWTDQSDNEDGFIIERSLTIDAGFEVIDNTLADLAGYVDVTVLEEVTYYYRVKAFNDVGESDYTNVLQVTTPLGIPDAPSELVGFPNGPNIWLGWVDNARNEDNYWVSRQNPDNRWTLFGPLPENSIEYTDTTVSPEATYKYRIYASNLAGNSGFSETRTVTTLGQPPETPTELEATRTGIVDLKLTWMPGSYNENAFFVERRNSPEEQWVVVGGTQGQTYYDDLRLTPETTYYYRVRGQNGAGYSDYSDEISAETGSLFIFEDGFEEYEEDEEPGGDWVYTTTDPAWMRVDDIIVHDEDFAMRVNDSDAGGNSLIYRSHDDMQMGEYTFWMFLTQRDGAFGINIQSTDTWNTGIEALAWFYSDSIQSNDGNQWFFYSGGDWPLEEWIEVTFEINSVTNTFTLSLDGEPILENHGMVFGNNVNHIFFQTFNNRTMQEAYVDDILVMHVIPDESPGPVRHIPDGRPLIQPIGEGIGFRVGR